MPSGSELQVLLGNVVVAQLSGDLSQPVLNWTSEWRQGGFLLAPSLPWEVNGLPPSGAAVRNFFENMLPEGMAFDHLLEYAQISRSNSIGLALHLGNDLPGAIRLRTENQFLQGHPDVFRIIAEDELDDRIGRMSAVPIDVWDGKPRLSVAGMQPKLNLLELNGHLGLCDGDRLASDRILKFSSAARPLLLLNECMTMRLAAAAGWPTAKAGMRQVGVHQALEIMRSDDESCRLPHFIRVERFLHLITVPALENINIRAISNDIPVGFPFRVKPRVEIERHLSFFCDSDITHSRLRILAARQKVVGGPHDSFRRYSEFTLEGSSLPQCMNPRIGAACPVYQNIACTKPGKYSLKFALHGSAARLPLPSAESAAVVFNCQENVSFHKSFPKARY